MCRIWVGGYEIDEEKEMEDIPWEPAGHGQIITGSVTSCREFWRTFVRISVVMEWIEHGYALL